MDIGADEAGQRIDNYLGRLLKGLPRSRIYRILRRGEVRVNRARVQPTYRLQAGDRLRIPPVRSEAPAPSAGGGRAVRRLDGRILYEDDRLLVIDKPSGMAVHGGSGISLGVIEALRAMRPEARCLELVHRLDRETSGCLLIAKRRSVLRELHALLRQGSVRKRYLILVRGRWALGSKTVSEPLRTDRRRGGERVVSVEPSGKVSATRFTPVQEFAGATLLEATTLTGRTHQIRVHAAHAGHPLAGDERYGDPAFNRGMRALGLTRLFLHAHAIGFEWPESGAPFEVSAPLDDELRDVLTALEGVS